MRLEARVCESPENYWKSEMWLQNNEWDFNWVPVIWTSSCGVNVSGNLQTGIHEHFETQVIGLHLDCWYILNYLFSACSCFLKWSDPHIYTRVRQKCKQSQGSIVVCPAQPEVYLGLLKEIYAKILNTSTDFVNCMVQVLSRDACCILKQIHLKFLHIYLLSPPPSAF